MITGGKSQYTNLLILIKHESPKLYEVICDLCLDGTFRSQRHQNTFLMPGPKLVASIAKMVDEDKDAAAIKAIRSLMLKNHLEKENFKSGANIGTLQFGSYVLAEPEVVATQISDSGKTVIVDRKDAYATIVYKYKGDEVPKTVEGKSGGMILVSKAGGSVSLDGEAKMMQEFTMKLVVRNDASATVNNFFKAVAGALIHLQDSDESKFARAKFYMASNPILSWFFLTKAGHAGALVPASFVKDFQWEAVTDLSIIKKAEEHDYKLDRGLLRKVKSHRSQLLNENGDRSALIREIKSSYNKTIKDALSAGAIDEYLSTRVDLKMLMDELRFMFDDAIKTWDQVDDAIDNLKLANWSEPSKSHVICNSELYEKNLVKGVEAFMSGPVTFVKSIYFMYAPLTDEVCDQLEKGMHGKDGGSIVGGNPASINNVVFSGGAARKSRSKKVSDVKLSSLLKVLSRDQREALKKML